MVEFLCRYGDRYAGRMPDMSGPSTFNPTTRTGSSIKQRDPSVSHLVSGNHAEILAWGDASAQNASGGDQKQTASTTMRVVLLLSLFPFC